MASRSNGLQMRPPNCRTTALRPIQQRQFSPDDTLLLPGELSTHCRSRDFGVLSRTIDFYVWRQLAPPPHSAKSLPYPSTEAVAAPPSRRMPAYYSGNLGPVTFTPLIPRHGASMNKFPSLLHETPNWVRISHAIDHELQEHVPR